MYLRHVLLDNINIIRFEHLGKRLLSTHSDRTVYYAKHRTLCRRFLPMVASRGIPKVSKSSTSNNENYSLIYEGPLKKRIIPVKVCSLVTATASLAFAPALVIFGNHGPVILKAVLMSVVLKQYIYCVYNEFYVN